MRKYKIKDLLIYLNPKDYVSKTFLAKGYHEYYLQKLCEFVCKGKKGLVLDVGSHIGAFSFPLAKKLKTINFYLFEVQREINGLAFKNKKLNKLNNIKIFNHGLSDKNFSCLVNLPKYIISKNSGSFSLEPKINLINKNVKLNKISERILLKKIDNIKFKSKILFIKIDVEGNELKVIKGAKLTIKKNKPIICFESLKRDENKFAKINQQLTNLSYKTFYLSHGNYVAIPKNYSELKIYSFFEILKKVAEQDFDNISTISHFKLFVSSFIKALKLRLRMII